MKTVVYSNLRRAIRIAFWVACSVAALFALYPVFWAWGKFVGLLNSIIWG